MTSPSQEISPKPPTLALNLAVLAILMALLLISAGIALLSLGPFNLIISLTTAIIKAVLVLIFFMRLNSDSALLRLVAGSGFVWLAILLTLTLADLLARGGL